MAKLCIFVGLTLGGIAFGWGADAPGCDFFVSFWISGAGSIIGCWAGWKIYQKRFS